MENRRGSGIFLGIVGVATLVVAIIGATFAYFSASRTAQNTVDLTAYEFNVAVDLEQVLPNPHNGEKLIPLAADDTVEGGDATNLAHALNTDAGCIYNVPAEEGEGTDYQACALYKLTVTNNGSNPIDLTGTLKTTRNSSEDGERSFANLKYRALTVAEENWDNPVGNITVSGSATPVPALNETIPLESFEGLAAGKTETRFFVVYLNEAEAANNAEMGSIYKGEVTYADPNTGSQLSATFSVSGTEA